MTHPKKLLDRYGLRPKQSLGQSFLADDNLLSLVVESARVSAGDQVLEIGPGVGNLTRHLAESGERIVAVELDERFLPILEMELAGYDNVEIVHGDILAFDPTTWFGTNPYKVVANVPYYITGAILEHLLSGRGKPQLVVLTVQKEVADRITAEPGEMSLLSASVQFYGEVEAVATIKAGAFWPRPTVDSALLRIDLRRGPLLPLSEEKAFFRLVKVGFSQKRKQLQKNLRALGYRRPRIMALLEEAGVDGRRRAETLSMGEWLSVYRVLQEASAS